MTEYSAALAKQVQAYLDSQNWRFDFNEEEGSFRFGMRLENRMKKCDLLITVGGDAFTVYAMAPVGADKDTMPGAMNFITRANYGLRLGNFELDLRDGELRYKSSLFCGSEAPSVAIVERVVDVTIQMWELYGNGLLNVLFGNADPAQEIAKIED